MDADLDAESADLQEKKGVSKWSVTTITSTACWVTTITDVASSCDDHYQNYVVMAYTI